MTKPLAILLAGALGSVLVAASPSTAREVPDALTATDAGHVPEAISVPSSEAAPLWAPPHDMSPLGQDLAGDESSSTSSDWSIVSSPNTIDAQPTNFLSGVTCVSESDCWSVGHSHVFRGTPQTLIEHWDGTAWTIVASPNTSSAKTNLLSRVTCISASDCWAVGWHHTGAVQQTLIEHWDGTSWSIVTSPNAGNARTNLLTDIACVSESDCWAVGNHFAGSDSQTLIARWNGTSWSIVTSPNTAATNNNFLSGVTCISESDCWAVGSSDSAIEQGIYRALIVHWDGKSWSIVPSPIAALVQPAFLSSVTCASASDCWAVGSTDTASIRQTLIVRWDGTSWSTVVSPNTSPVRHNVLHSVTCASSSDCWAVGYARTGTSVMGLQAGSSVDQTLIEHWDGTSWSIVTSPNTNTAQTNVLYGVTCASASECWSVGYADSGGSQTLAERWDGTSWSIVDSPNVWAGQAPNHLHNVTCLDASLCWAVGYYFNGSVYQTLVQRWNGTAWSIVASPSTSSQQNNLLTGVSCVSASQCWAVGYTDNGSVLRNLIQRWNGTSWSIVAAPNTGAEQHNFLSGVTCVSASDCWAVGSSGGSDSGSGVYQTLIQRWNGTAWSIVPSANTSPVQGNVVYSVECPSPSDCWAVGYFFTGSVRQTLIERWDGTSWTIVTSPNTSATNLLTDVTCASASDCWAVGHSNATGTNQTLIERWNGTSWDIVASPNTSATRSNFLFGVTCASPSDCWAVGDSFAGGVTQTLIERWDGVSWSIATSPNHSATRNNLLLGVTCVSASDCWAVGYHHNGSVYQTLTLRYTADPGTSPTPDVTATPTDSSTPDPTPTESPSMPEVEPTTTTFTDRSQPSGQYSDETTFEARLTDSDGDPIADVGLIFELAGEESTRSFSATTDDDGVASVTPTLTEKPGPHQLTVRYAGDDDHEGSADTITFVVEREDTDLELTVEGKGNKRTLTARLADRDTPNGIAGRTIDFFADGDHIGSATTDSEGIATLNAPPRYRGGKHDFEARFEGDDYYLGSSRETAI